MFLKIAPLVNVYAAHRRFDPSAGERWRSFVQWSGFHNIDEVVSTDQMLCPNLVEELIDADWEHNLHKDSKLHLFRDLEYLKRRVNYDARVHNLLCLVERPKAPVFPEAGFELCGYDILDSFDSVSVLTNCGPFPHIFLPSELNRCALLDDLERAWQIAAAIRGSEPEDPHCSDCRVWAICRLNDVAGQK
jgi:hypothetical protein